MKYSSPYFIASATDLSNHLSCRHLTQLNRKFALGELKKPYRNDPSLDVLAKRGREHEAAYVESLVHKGLKVVNLQGQAVEATLQAMTNGADVIVQARLEKDFWMGYADILLKVPGQSKFGDWSYEIQDTKLSQNTRAATILQLCLYSDLLSILQGSIPEKMYVVKPGENFVTEEFFHSDFQAYYRLVKKNFEEVISGPPLELYPESVEHCGVCGWWRVCDKKRHDDDHLSLVAGIRSLQIDELQKQSIFSLEEFATMEQIVKPDRGNLDSLVRKQSQAKVQFQGRVEKRLLYQLLPIEKGRGFNRLPEPNKGDIYFDIEGDAFFPDGGLEYLLGYAYKESDGSVSYQKIWATTRLEEKKAFATFMQFVIERWKRNPNLYIYHFAPYEPSAVKRLARVHAIFEKEVDELLRAERFVDLHAVFKEALWASVERYSLKDLEKFTQYTRKVDLPDASVARKAVECALELNEIKILPGETLKQVEDYNEDDCLATEALHQWLETLRQKLVSEGLEITRPAIQSSEATEKIQQQDIRSQALFKSLTQSLPDDRTTWTNEHHAKWLLAHQIDYFRREDKSAWWEYYRVHELEHEDLLDERKAVTGLVFMEVLPLKGKDRNATHRYQFPTQEMGITEGDEVIEIKGDKIGEVQSVSLERNTIDIKKTAKSKDRHPFAVHVSERIDPGSLATSLMNLADSIQEYGLSHKWPYHASKDLLLRRKPQLLEGKEGADLKEEENHIDGAIRIALTLDRSILPIQGPPGTGKTHTGAKMIISLHKAGKKIGVTAISHSVIRTLFEKVKQLCDEENYIINFIHKVTDKSEVAREWLTETSDSKKALASLGEGSIVGGTAWLWSDDQSSETLDYLFIDEAGQMSLSQALAASRAAKNIILLGDPQQLEQPQKGSHPEGSDIAALTYLLEGHPTMPEGKGLFLGTTRRIHPEITKFTSEIFYEGKLKSLPGLENQVVGGGTSFDGAGLFYVPVKHSSNQNRSPEEVDAVVDIVNGLLATGTWTNAEGKTFPLSKEDILIVAPYNAQVGALIEKLPGLRIGTVDKFQGKEAPIVIFSMTSSTTQDAPRGMNFLFSPNRLNVASSRAKSVCILVASPLLLEADCSTIDQMRWANGLCRFLELARRVRLHLPTGLKSASVHSTSR